MARPIEVLLVDQDADARYGIRSLLAQTDIHVVAEAPFGTEAVARARETRPDIICCAMKDPPVRALETIDGLLNELPETPVIVYSSSSDIEFVRKAMLAGAREFLVHPFTADAFVGAAQAVLGWEEERRMRLSGRNAQVRARGTVVTVFSAKGGVGKTTFATSLAAALASDVGQSVAVVDADTSFGDVLVALNLSSNTDLAQFVRARAIDPETDINDYLVKHESGLEVLPAPSNPFDWNAIDPQDFKSVIDSLARTKDYVVVDLSPAPNAITMAAIEDSSIVFWILSPDVFTLRDNMMAAELLRREGLAGDKVRFVVNHASPNGELSESSISAAMDAPIYWEIPYDRQLHRRTQLGVTISATDTEGKAAKRLIGLARELAGVPTNNGNSNRGSTKRPRLLRAFPGVS